MVRMGLCASLNVEPDMEGVAEVDTGESTPIANTSRSW